MEFLKAIYGDKALTYEELVQALNAHNGDEANKENQIKIGNLGGGEYIGKAKYDALQQLLDGKTSELDTANTLIADLKKNSKGDDALQQKVTDYETQVATLKAENEKLRLESAVKVALLEAKATDIDYLSFKLKEKGEIKLDDAGNITGLDELISGLKTQFPTHFEQGANKVIPNKLPNSNSDPSGYTKSDILKMPYTERNKLYEENPDAYNAAMKS